MAFTRINNASGDRVDVINVASPFASTGNIVMDDYERAVARAAAWVNPRRAYSIRYGR